MLLEAGRSFSPAVMSQLDDDEVDSAFRSDGGHVRNKNVLLFGCGKGKRR